MVHCPSCGAGLRFDIESQQMFCEHCQGQFSPKSLYELESDEAKTEKTFDSYAYICPSCGAELETTDPNDAVGFCPYCGGASMIYDKIRKQWKPDFVIPFKVTKDQCRQLYCDEVKKFPFVSGKYRDPDRVGSFRGIYMPYCEFGGGIKGDVTLIAHSAERNMGNYHFETDVYEVTGHADFDISGGAAHDASFAFDDNISEHLEPYDRGKQQPYAPGYLCGFYAETGDVNPHENDRLKDSEISRAFHNAADNDPKLKEALKPEKLRIKSGEPGEKLPTDNSVGRRMLYPVWFMSYRRGKKITYAAVNGQTGKLYSDLPLSPIKILLFALGCSATIFGLLFALMRFLPSIPANTTIGVTAMLGITGMYVLQHSYINTVGTALSTESLVQPKIPTGFFVSAAAAVIGVIMASTDGSYDQYRFLFGTLILFVSVIINLKHQYRQSKQTKSINSIYVTSNSMQTNGILAEAKRFNRINRAVRTVMLITMLGCLALSYSESIKSPTLIVCAVVAGAELVLLALMHIRFQVNSAKHKLPQFNKKGAAYDEN